jgi:hypothetical protein
MADQTQRLAVAFLQVRPRLPAPTDDDRDHQKPAESFRFNVT